MSPPRATSSTLFGAGGAGAGSSLSSQDRLDFLGGSGCLGGGALADGVGEGRDGDAPYALSNTFWLGARVGVSILLGLGTRGGPGLSTMFGLGTRAGTASAKLAFDTLTGSMLGFGTRRGSSTMAEPGVRPSAEIGFWTRVSIMLRFGTRPGTLATRRSSAGGAIICCSLIVSRMGSLIGSRCIIG